jgi:hypothetical protein
MVLFNVCQWLKRVAIEHIRASLTPVPSKVSRAINVSGTERLPPPDNLTTY